MYAVLTRAELETPIGTMLVVYDREALVHAIDWEEYEARMHRLLLRRRGMPTASLTPGKAPIGISELIERYFAGQLDALQRLRLATDGTPFPERVWSTLRQIRPGTTWSYGALAAAIGQRRAVRAVGLANGANPIGVAIPCHRVIGSGGALTGYGGGLARKRWLLAHEGAAELIKEDRT